LEKGGKIEIRPESLRLRGLSKIRGVNFDEERHQKKRKEKEKNCLEWCEGPRSPLKRQKKETPFIGRTKGAY